MKRMFALLTSMAILVLLVPLALAQEPSPAGGMFLEFNGKDAFLSLKAGKLVNTKFENITVEAWIYLRTFPEKQGRWVITAKPGSFELLVVGPDPDNPNVLRDAPFGYSFIQYTVNPNAPGEKSALGLTWQGGKDQLNNWYHISGGFDVSSQMCGLSFHGKLGTSILPVPKDAPQSLVNTDSPFSIGGTKEWENSYFDGFIDEVRISSVVRYKDSFVPPKGPFKADMKTLALWHFNGGFADSSGNGNTLIGKGVTFSVEPAGKLSTTWANIKNED